MPELPEVETIRNQLKDDFADHPKVFELNATRKDLRFPMPKPKDLEALKGLPIQDFQRRAKYLLFDFGDLLLLSHLGMTGNWRTESSLELKKHDHFWLRFDGKKGSRYLVYEDARRFGFLDILKKKNWSESKWFSHLGPEPWDKKNFHAAHLKGVGKNSSRPIKTFIMDQQVVVGVGNIYASEALFCAGVRPQRLSKTLKSDEWTTLAKCIPKILKDSVRAGGTTLRDYKDARGQAGQNQNFLKVYDRVGKPCLKCKTPIRRSVIGGRSTFWCPKCQK